MTLQHLRSNTAHKRPLPSGMSDGQIAINTEGTSPGLFFKSGAGNLIKVGPVHVGTSAPNVSPASGGTTGNTVGEQWLDTSGGGYLLKIWDGSAWRSEQGQYIDAAGDIMSGALGVIAGSASVPSVYFSGDTNTGFYSPGADQLAITTSGTERLRIASDGKVGIGTSAVDANHLLQANGTIASVTGSGAFTALQAASGIGFRWALANDGAFRLQRTVDGFSTVSGTAIYIDGSDRVGISTTSPLQPLHVNGNVLLGGTSASSYSPTVIASDAAIQSAAPLLNFVNASGSTRFGYVNHTGTGGNLYVLNQETGALQFGTANAERARIDSAGRFLVGVTSGITSASVEVLSTLGIRRHAAIPEIGWWRSSGTSGAPTVVADGDTIGRLYAAGYDGTNYINAARIEANVDGAPGANDMPGRLVFSTTADGASSPTERLRIASTGAFGLSGANYGTSGQVLTSAGAGSTPTWTTITAGNVSTGSNNAFTGANTFYNATGQTFGTATSTQDGIVLQGRAGGSLSYRVTFVPGTLSSNRTLTLPDTTGTVITTGDSGTVTNTMLAGSIADSKLSTISTAGKVSGTAITSGNISTSGSFATTSTLAVGQASAAANTDLDLNGTYAQTIVAVSALDIDCSTGNYFTKTINANSTFTVSNIPSSRAYSFTLELTHTSGTITWFSGVEWPNGTAPTLTTGKTHLFFFVTDDGGTRWRAASQINYTN